MLVLYLLKLLIISCKDINKFLHFLSWPIFVSLVGPLHFVPSADGFDRVEVKREEVIVPIVKTGGKRRSK